MKPVLALFALLALGSPASAALTPADVGAVRAASSPNARAPLDLPFRDDAGRPTTLRAALGGKVGLLVFADYTCSSLCGLALVLTKAGLEASGLAPGRDYRLAVVGLNPKDGPAAAEAMRRQRLGDDLAIDRATSFLIGDAAAVRRATAAMGYHYAYDAAHDQYAHPAVAYVLRSDGRVASVTPEIGLAGPALKAALIAARTEAPAPSNGVAAGLHLLCYGFDPAHGLYNGATIAALRWGALGLFGIGALVLARVAFRRRESVK